MYSIVAKNLLNPLAADCTLLYLGYNRPRVHSHNSPQVDFAKIIN
jgi:hypothetical protein